MAAKLDAAARKSALGALKGPDIGELLKRLEREWIESGFALDRDQLLAKASAFIAAQH